MVVITTAACCVRRAGAHFIFIVFIMLGPLQGREPIFSPLHAAAAASGGGARAKVAKENFIKCRDAVDKK